ncbi:MULTISPECIES: hypothetical protein [Streptomyces]|uniref:Uncharacterized protein n=2 Tax=Streptomyces TaxID=1883 RepID=A0A2N8PGH4_STRNR|nr:MULTISPECIES: hypothetical protein [Streptomyces]PNE40120.1 hypothetical protein AOB60_03630 [Streptomyces noursei]SHL36472.1 hypothetical protein SAMN05216268_10458 [Streptomyces yunnanensis]
MTQDTEDLLRTALHNLASSMPDASQTSYRKEQMSWRRREYRRRCVVAILVFVIVAVACTIGLVTLSGASPDTHVIFNRQTAQP